MIKKGDVLILGIIEGLTIREETMKKTISLLIVLMLCVSATFVHAQKDKLRAHTDHMRSLVAQFEQARSDAEREALNPKLEAALEKLARLQKRLDELNETKKQLDRGIEKLEAELKALREKREKEEPPEGAKEIKEGLERKSRQ